MPPSSTTVRWRAMGSEVELVIVSASPAAADPLAALARTHLAELEARWSRFVPTSDVSRLNVAEGRPVAVAPSTVRLVTAMVEAWRATAGRYDPTLLPLLVDLGYRASWHDPAAVSAVAPGSTWRTGPAGVLVDAAAGVVQLPAGSRSMPAASARVWPPTWWWPNCSPPAPDGALLSVGGDLRAAGEAPQPGGWIVDVADPHDPSRAVARLALADGGVATSGTDVRRWRTSAGDTVHHVLDPATGRPPGTGHAPTWWPPPSWPARGAWADAWPRRRWSTGRPAHRCSTRSAPVRTS